MAGLLCDGQTRLQPNWYTIDSLSVPARLKRLSLADLASTQEKLIGHPDRHVYI